MNLDVRKKSSRSWNLLSWIGLVVGSALFLFGLGNYISYSAAVDAYGFDGPAPSPDSVRNLLIFALLGLGLIVSFFMRKKAKKVSMVVFSLSTMLLFLAHAYRACSVVMEFGLSGLMPVDWIFFLSMGCFLVMFAAGLRTLTKEVA